MCFHSLIYYLGLILCLCIQIKKDDIVYPIGDKKKLKSDFKVEMYPPFLTLVPNRGSTSKDPPYENVSLQGIDHSISFHCDLLALKKGMFNVHVVSYYQITVEPL